jgi:hypothetical protein
MWIGETNRSLAPWMLLSALRSTKMSWRGTTSDIRTRVEKCFEVDGGILKHLLWTVTDLLFMCRRFDI